MIKTLRLAVPRKNRKRKMKAAQTPAAGKIILSGRIYTAAKSPAAKSVISISDYCEITPAYVKKNAIYT